MNRPLAIGLGFVLMVMACVAEAGLRRVEANVHGTVLLVEFLEGGHCTAVRVKPRDPKTTEILIVAHCVSDKPPQVLIGKKPIDIRIVHFGPGDQARAVLAMPSGKYAEIGDPPKQGDEVFMFGNPGRQRDQLRRGYITGTSESGQLLSNMPVAGGDSGAPVFNERGQVVALLSAVAIEYAVGMFGPVPTMHASELQPITE